MRTLRANGREVCGLDIKPSPFTDIVASIADRTAIARAMRGVGAVLHAATLHKPHVATHSRQEFVDVNVSGTLNLLEEAAAASVGAFVFTSTTSVYGFALKPEAGAPAVWVDEDLVPVPKNIYGITKLAAEELCALFRRKFALPCLILRTSRFFPEEDDDADTRAAYADANVKCNELLYRRTDIEDIVAAHACALDRALAIGFGRYVISGTTPFSRSDAARVRIDLPGLVRERIPDYEPEYVRRGWKLPAGVGRIYDNTRARVELGWQPRHDFRSAIAKLRESGDFRSDLARTIGSKGYHAETFASGPYPVD